MIIRIGNLKKEKSKAGAEYFTGYINNVPVLGFYKKTNPNAIDIRVDVEKVNWIDKKKAEAKKEEKK